MVDRILSENPVLILKTGKYSQVLKADVKWSQEGDSLVQ